MKSQSLPILGPSECAHATWLEDYLTSVPDFPQKGVLFQWCSPLLRDPQAFNQAISVWLEHYRQRGYPDVIVGLESRGFFLGAVLANHMKLPFIVMRKPGKLPHAIGSQEQSMEYGSVALELEKGAIKQGEAVLIVDDVLATGGTAVAACELVRQVGGVVYELTCLLEIIELEARTKLSEETVYSLLAL